MPARTAPPAHPYLDWPGPIPFAHRGGASEAPENTMPAFQLAVDLGYRYLETDVHATADGVLVAFHDDDLERTAGRSGRISELTWDEVSTARVDGREPIPLLEELLSSFPDARLNIDCKADGAVPALVACLRRARVLDRVCVGAFSDRRLRTLRRALGPELLTSMGPRQIAGLKLTGRPIGSSRVAQVPVRQGRVTVTDRRFVAQAHAHGVVVHVWTIDEADEMHRLLDLGVDGLMTDRPVVLREVLTARGQWQGAD